MHELWIRWSSYGLATKNILFPQFCRACGQRILTEENVHFCPTCWELSARIERPFCRICGRPRKLTVGADADPGEELFQCGECLAAPRPFRRCIGAVRYDGPAAEAIKLFKFRERLNLREPLAELLAELVQREVKPEAYDALVPVPLHPVRLRDRGYNQSALLAESVLSLFPRARLDQNLRRIRPTRTQSLIEDPQERRRNVRGAFAVDPKTYAGQTVLLIDDVATSHTTVSECACVITRAGAHAVDVMVAALAAPN
jgi:ComF family protein